MTVSAPPLVGRERTPPRTPWLLLAVALVLTCLAYAASLRGPFLFDDLSEIVDNPAIRRLVPPWPAMFAGGELPHRPLPYLTFAMNYAVGRLLTPTVLSSPLDPLPFHLVNVVVHLLNGWLVYSIASRLLIRFGPALQTAQPATVAAVAALLWLVHPLATQAVSYVYQRIELLAALATLGTLAAFLQSLESRRPTVWLTAAVACCGLGMACKEWVVVVPVIVLLLDGIVVTGSFRQVLARRWRFHAINFSTWVILAAVVVSQRSHYPEAGFTARQALTYAMNQPAVIGWYLSRIVLPVNLALDHGAPLRTDWFGPDWWLLIPLAAMLTTMTWCVANVRRRPLAAWGVGTFLLLLAPTSSVLPVHDACVEHRMYLPSAVALVGATAGIGRLLGDRLVPCATALAVLLATVSAARNTIYATPLAAWADAVAKSGSSRAFARYANELSGLDRHDAAIAAGTEAVRRNPANPVPYAALAAACLNADRLAEAAAVAEAGLATGDRQRAGFRDPVLDRLAMYLGMALDRQGDPRGRPLLEEAVRRRPDSLAAREHLARSLVRDDPGRAALIWQSLANDTPDEPYVLFNLGSTLARIDPAAAVPILEDAVRLDPGNADALNNLGNSLLASGRVREAVEAYTRCLAIATDHPQAAANLRAITASSP